MQASPHSGAGGHQPRLIFWEVTKGCNLHCGHCRATATELASPNDLPTRLCLNFIDQIAAAADPILVLSGGEPLYRPDIFQLARYATDKGLRVALATNGTLVTKDVALQIVRAGVKRVSISLDGSCAETHDTFRGIPGSFDAAVYGFRNLKELGMPVQIEITITRHNAAELSKALELARGLGADALQTFLPAPMNCGAKIDESQRISPDEYERILNRLRVEAAENGIELGKTESGAACAPNHFQLARQRGGDSGSVDSGPVDSETMDAMNEGRSGTGVCFLSFEGEVYPGGSLFPAGDLRKQSFAEVWNNSAVRECALPR